jgi:hypothetical protein
VTDKETAKLLGIIAISYQNFKLDKEVIAVWHEMIGDLDFTLAQMAVKKLISESPFPPTIHDIRRRAMEAQFPDLPTPAEAWGIVNRAMRKHGRYDAERGLDGLPHIVREAAECIGFREMCESEDPDGVLRGQFMKVYEQVLNRRKGEHILPLPLQNQIKALASQMALPGGDA